MYIDCLPSHNCLLKSEDKQFAQLVCSVFSIISELCVLSSARGGQEGSEGYVQCILLFGFPMVWRSCLPLFWPSRQSVYHMESVGRKTVSSVFLLDPPLALSFIPSFLLSTETAAPSNRKLT